VRAVTAHLARVPGARPEQDHPGRPLIQGILNVTPDSFSDGGRWNDPAAALAHGLDLIAQGADLIDVGGESTRPGAVRVGPREELARVLPVVTGLVEAGVPVSVDTSRASVAAACLAAGASWINDITGGADPEMLPAVAASGAGYMAMHTRGDSETMASLARYDDVVAEVCAELAERRDAALAAGIASDRLVLDPGIGFAKTAQHNWALLGAWSALDRLGFPLLLAVSRKAFLGRLLGSAEQPVPPGDRDAASVALTALFAARGVWGVRVHDVRPHADAARTAVRLAAQPRAAEPTVTIALSGVRARGFHGVLAEERRRGQEFVVDARLDVTRTRVSDDLDTTVDYGGLAEALVADIEREPVDLIETLAARLLDTCLAAPLVSSATVTVHKPSAPIDVPFTDVAVTLSGRRR
jgi:dihydropteroate synthase